MKELTSKNLELLAKIATYETSLKPLCEDLKLQVQWQVSEIETCRLRQAKFDMSELESKNLKLERTEILDFMSI